MTELNNTQRAAVLLLALDEDSAAEVFKHLSAREVQEVSQEMAKLGNCLLYTSPSPRDA